jgi:hypothetical protein
MNIIPSRFRQEVFAIFQNIMLFFSLISIAGYHVLEYGLILSKWALRD